MGIILASSSPRRKKILENLGYNFHIVVPNIDEHNINNLNPIDYVIDVSIAFVSCSFDRNNDRSKNVTRSH